MPDNHEPNMAVAHEAQARLHEVAGKLRQSGPLDQESQRALAALIDELGNALQSGRVPVVEVTRLVQGTAHLVESLHEKDHGLLTKARDRLERALSDAEAHAPVAVGLARNLLDVLSNMGI